MRAAGPSLSRPRRPGPARRTAGGRRCGHRVHAGRPRCQGRAAADGRRHPARTRRGTSGTGRALPGLHAAGRALPSRRGGLGADLRQVARRRVRLADHGRPAPAPLPLAGAGLSAGRARGSRRLPGRRMDRSAGGLTAAHRPRWRKRPVGRRHRPAVGCALRGGKQAAPRRPRRAGDPDRHRAMAGPYAGAGGRHHLQRPHHDRGPAQPRPESVTRTRMHRRARRLRTRRGGGTARRRRQPHRDQQQHRWRHRADRHQQRHRRGARRAGRRQGTFDPDRSKDNRP